MYTQACKVTEGISYIPGICIFCLKPFNEESSGGYFYGHKICAENTERQWAKEDFERLKSLLPIGTRFTFTLVGGAACD